MTSKTNKALRVMKAANAPQTRRFGDAAYIADVEAASGVSRADMVKLARAGLINLERLDLLAAAEAAGQGDVARASATTEDLDEITLEYFLVSF